MSTAKRYIFRAAYKCDKTIKTDNEITGPKFRVGFISDGEKEIYSKKGTYKMLQ